MKTQLKITLKYLLISTILTGVIYPLLMTGVAQVAFHEKANGSLVMKDGKLLGSRLLGQKFDSTIYFSSRPSAIDYNPVPSSGSNLGPTSKKLRIQVSERRKTFAIRNDVIDDLAVPPEMLFASGSGLDPHISPEGALIQYNRVVISRRFNDVQKSELMDILKDMTLNPQFYLFGEPRINVFELNLALDTIK